MFEIFLLANVYENIVENDYVLKSKSFVLENTAVVSIISKPIYSRQKRFEIEKEIQNLAKQKFGVDKVVVSFDVDVFAMIENELSVQKMEDIIQTIERRR